MGSEMIQGQNEKGQIEYANKAWLENMGFGDISEVKGRPVLEFFTDDTLKEFISWCQSWWKEKL